MKNVLDFNDIPVCFEYNSRVYYLFEREQNNSCSICCFNKKEDRGLSCNEAKSELISCYASGGKMFWSE